MLVPFHLKSKLFYSWTMQSFLYTCICLFICGCFLLEHIPQKRNIHTVHDHSAAPVDFYEMEASMSAAPRVMTENALNLTSSPVAPMIMNALAGSSYLISQITGKFYLLLKFKWNQPSCVRPASFSQHFVYGSLLYMSVKLQMNFYLPFYKSSRMHVKVSHYDCGFIYWSQ